MGLLEDALRDTLAGQVSSPPVVDDVAGRAIHGARVVRRRRAMMTSVAAVLSVVLAGGVAFAVANGPSSHVDILGNGNTPTTGGPVSPSVGLLLPVDVLVGDQLLVSDGTAVRLTGIGKPEHAWRVAGGWLVQTNNSATPPLVAPPYPPERLRSVWFVDPSGDYTQLASGDATMVSRGSAARPGPQVAWTENGRLHLATYAGGQLTAGAATLGIGRLAPQRFVGTGVLLAASQTGGGLDIWDMWFPDKGAFVEDTTSAKPSAVLGSTVDNKQLYALYGGKPPCFGALDPVGFTPTRSSCILPFGLDDRVYPSPDGKWWVVQNSGGLAQYEADVVWDRPAAVRQWPMNATNLAFVTDHSLVVAAAGVVSLIDLTTGAIDNLDVPAPTGAGSFEVVEDLRT